MGEIMSSLGLETGKNLGKQCTCADNFSNLLKRGPTMKKLVDKFIRVFVILFLGAAGAAQAEHVLSNNPTEWWSPDGGLTYPYVAPDEAAIPPIGDPRGDRIRGPAIASTALCRPTSSTNIRISDFAGSLVASAQPCTAPACL